MRRMQARLATLEERFIPSPNATRDALIQRALVRLTAQELRQLMQAAKLQEEGRERELTVEHHALISRQNELILEERALASGRR